VTARPSDALGLIRDATSRSLRKAGVAKLAIETGTLLGLFSKRLMADGKLANIREIQALYPEYRVLFLGDSGQGDVLVAEDLLPDCPDAVAFIHDVVDTPAAERDAYAACGIHFFDTYVGCATRAMELGLIARAARARRGARPRGVQPRPLPFGRRRRRGPRPAGARPRFGLRFGAPTSATGRPTRGGLGAGRGCAAVHRTCPTDRWSVTDNLLLLAADAALRLSCAPPRPAETPSQSAGRDSAGG
jgi:hypothetical protein